MRRMGNEGLIEDMLILTWMWPLSPLSHDGSAFTTGYLYSVSKVSPRWIEWHHLSEEERNCRKCWHRVTNRRTNYDLHTKDVFTCHLYCYYCFQPIYMQPGQLLSHRYSSCWYNGFQFSGFCFCLWKTQQFEMVCAVEARWNPQK